MSTEAFAYARHARLCYVVLLMNECVSSLSGQIFADYLKGNSTLKKL